MKNKFKQSKTNKRLFKIFNLNFEVDDRTYVFYKLVECELFEFIKIKTFEIS